MAAVAPDKPTADARGGSVFAAIERGDVPKLAMLIESKADLNATNAVCCRSHVTRAIADALALALAVALGLALALALAFVCSRSEANQR